MYLKRIEIYGFKSFAQRSVLDFEYKDINNITAVVGPNGSGKSNVADAIRWVTGEQSSKNLRSKKSEDILFCGSAGKARGSFAEVSIILASEKPVKFELNGKEYELLEIEVSRKLYRSGESEYLINHKKVRLTDINQLLASLGFGQSSYTVIGQGMVDRLLFFSASERKVLFDEAAGVKQYELKRDQSLRKLESTEANLVRLKDILVELEPRVVNLRRLVKRAEGRKDLEKDYLDVQNSYYGSLLTEYNALIGESSIKEEQIKEKISKIVGELDFLQAESGSIKDNPHRKERENLEDEISRETDLKESLREEIAYIRGQIASFETNKEQMNHERDTLLTEIERLDLRISNQTEEISKKLSEKEKAETELKKETSNLAMIEERLSSLDKELVLKPGHGNDSQAKLVADLEILQKKKGTLVSDYDDLREQKALLAGEKQQSLSVLNDLKVGKQNFEVLLKELVSSFEEISGENRALHTKVSVKQRELESIEKDLKKVESEVNRLISQVKEENLQEFSVEIDQIANSHTEILDKITGLRLDSDIAKIKAEFTDFSSNLTKLMRRFQRVIKAVSVNERQKVEKRLSLLRDKSSFINRELKELEYNEMNLSAKLALYEAKISETKKGLAENNENITKQSALISNLEKQGIADNGGIEKSLKLVEAEIEKLEDRLASYSKETSERQNVVLRKKDAEQSKYHEQRQVVHNLELILSRKQADYTSAEAEKNNLEVERKRLGVELSRTEVSDKTGIGPAMHALKEKENLLSKKDADIAKLRGGLTVIVSKEKEFENRNANYTKEIYELESDKAKLQTQLNNIELENAKVTVRLEDITKEIENRGICLEGLKNAQILDQMEKDVLRLKMENIRRKLDTTASIDPETEAEFVELESRATQMVNQVEDLEKAKADLKKVVTELDNRIKNQFSDVFTNIASEFNRYFTILFGGGKANLALGEDAEGTFGIEITANPPGKRVQSLSALSGGERTLTSLALLFAILSVNPSPFIVLDEVDAALDESNTVRFTKILDDLAKKTQFIIISHNRETMKSASSLYGVTMDDTHVSRLLSVKLTEAVATAK